MTTSNKEYNPSWFAKTGHENDSGNWDENARELLREIKEALPELAKWGDLPLGMAWADYSQDVWLVSWLDKEQHFLDREGLFPFLAYIHYHGTTGRPPKWGLSIEDLNAYVRTHGLS